MTQRNLLRLGAEEWGQYFANRQNTREISYHGGGSHLFRFFEMDWYREGVVLDFARQNAYANMVQAVLDSWSELASVKREPFEDEPISLVADLAFTRKGVMLEELRSSYNRLWRASPRPLTDSHACIALNSRGELPVTQEEVRKLVNECDEWQVIAFYIASSKGWLNDAIAMMESLIENGSAASVAAVVHGFLMGVPKIKALRWMSVIYEKTGKGKLYITRWKKELLDEGITLD